MKTSLFATALLLQAAFTCRAQVYTGPYGPGGTFNVYTVVTTAATWAAADTAAKAATAASTGLPALAGNLLTGHLVQIGSEDENTFVAMIATIRIGSGNSNIWTGLNDLNAEQGTSPVGWEWSGTTGGSGTNGAQVLGTDTTYSAWFTGEPNNIGPENAGEMRADGRWNDQRHDTSTVTRRYVIEWETGSATPPAGATPFPVYYTAPHGPGGSWNLYKFVAAAQNFDTARSMATNASAGSSGFAGVSTAPLADLQGHLATIGSAFENDLIFRMTGFGALNTQGTWIGASDSPAYDANASESGTSKTAGWVWIDRTNADPFVYQKFDTRYPLNIAEQPDNSAGTESVLEMKGTSFWNDITPAAATLRRYVIEWPVNALNPIAGAPVAPSLLPGPTPALANAHAVGTWSIKEQRGNTAASIFLTIDTIYNNTGTASQTTRPVLSQTDNAVSGAAGRSTNGFFWPKRDLVGDVAATDDNNYTILGKTRIQLDSTGPYTINVHSDDGFICRISGTLPNTVNITQVSGLGMKDPGDSAFYYPFGTGDTNTRAVFTVSAPGVYEVEYVGWDGTGGSFQEVSWCTGAAPNEWDGDWQLLGGPYATPATPTVLAPAASFNAPAPPPDGSWAFRYLPVAGGAASLYPTAYSASDALQLGTGALDATAPYFNFADPNNGGNRGWFSAELPFPGDTAVDDNNFVIGGRALLTIPQAGVYTIASHSDDNIAIRLTGGAKWRGRVWSTTSQGFIDSNDSSVLWWLAATADSNIRAAAFFPAAGTYEIQALYYEGTGSGAAELYYAPGVQLADADTSSWKIIGNLALLSPALPATLANGPVSSGGQWGLRYLKNSGFTMNSLTDAVNALQSDGGESFYSLAPVLNFIDPSNAGTGGLFGGDQPLPDDTAGTDDNDVVLHAKAKINIPTTGPYTFCVRCSDGFALRLKNVPWVNKAGAAGIDPADPTTLLLMPGTTALTENTSRGLVNLTAGIYDIEFITFDRTRDFNAEVFAIPGNQIATGEYAAGATANNGAATINAADGWRLVGYKAPVDPVGILGVSDPGAWSMTQTLAIAGATAPAGWGTAAATADAFFTNATGKLGPALRDMVNSRDPAGGTGLFPNDYPNLNDVANQDDNYYVTRFEGTLVVPVAGTYNVGWQGDDGGYFEFLLPADLPQPQFTRVVANAIGSAIVANASDGGTSARIQLDAGGGNTRTTGEIVLQAGQYPVRVQWFEGTGGSYFEAFASPSVANSRIVRLMTRAGAATFTDTSGIEIVNPEMNVTNVSLTGGQFSFTFTSQAGANYIIESSTSMATPWTVVNPAFASQGATTTWTGPVNPATPPGIQFFRARLAP